MKHASTLSREIDAYNDRWGNMADGPSFTDLANMLTGIVRIKRHAAETALLFPKGSMRELVVRAYNVARNSEKTIRTQLGLRTCTPDVAG